MARDIPCPEKRGGSGAEKDVPSPKGLVFTYCRRSVGWTQQETEAKCGLGRDVVSGWETGKRDPSPEELYRTTAVMGFCRGQVDMMLLFFRQLSRRPLPPVPQDLAWGVDAGGFRICEEESTELAFLVSLSHQELQLEELSCRRLREARASADRLYRQLMSAPRERRGSLVGHHRAFQTWLVVERLCEASEGAAPKDPEQALYLANLALRAARSALVDEKNRCRMQGYAYIFIANAQRVRSEFQKADEAFSQAEALWQEGDGAQEVLLEGWMLFDAKASLRLDQRRWREALSLHDAALERAPFSALGRILVNKAAAFEELGESRSARKVLCEAEPLVNEAGNRGLFFAWRFAVAVNLVYLGRPEEAERLIPELRRLGTELGRTLDVIRCRWLQGRSACEAGRLDEGIAELALAREEFTAREVAYDAALVALEQAVFLTKAARNSEAKAVAEQILWVFQAKGIREEALKALRVFCEAARMECLTEQLAREVRELYCKAR